MLELNHFLCMPLMFVSLFFKCKHMPLLCFMDYCMLLQLKKANLCEPIRGLAAQSCLMTDFAFHVFSYLGEFKSL